MNTLHDRTLADIVLSGPTTAPVLEHYGLDYCCKGGRSLAQSCAEKGLDVAEVARTLQSALSIPLEDVHAVRPETMGLTDLADHIERVHHRYVESAMPSLLEHTKKIAAVHGKAHPELLEVRDLFAVCAGELAKHMKKEELILFPQIRRMDKARAMGLSVPPPPFGSVANPIAMMEQEHAAEGDRLARIRDLTNDYAVPADGCTTYQLTFKELKRFEEDLHVHVHLENHLLFPKALRMEAGK